MSRFPAGLGQAPLDERLIRGELTFIAAIMGQPVIEKVLKHLGLQARAPPRESARGQTLLHAA